MKKLIFSLLFLPLIAFGENISDFSKQNNQISDLEFARRSYLSLGGRVATLEELEEYKKSPNREELVKEILISDDYTSHFYNKLADLLRIKPRIEGIDCKFYPYIDYVKKSIKEDKGFDQFTKEVMSARGKMLENPATGFLIRDNGMSLCNLSYTTQIFLGTDISCAQCHDDPFQDWTQIEFYQMASYFGGVDTRDNNLGENKEEFKSLLQVIKNNQGKDDLENPMRQILRANSFSVKDKGVGIRLPRDYQYDDAAPNQHIDPKTIFGDENIKTRENFSLWIVDQNRFSLAVSNRIWGWVMGKPLIQNENNIHINDSVNPELSAYLSKRFRQLNFSVRRLVYEIATSRQFSNKAVDPSFYNGSSPVIYKLSAEQLWDSILTIKLGKQEESYPSERYIETMLLNQSPSMEDIKSIVDDYRGFNPIPDAKNERGFLLVRSSMLLDRGSKTQSFLELFGASERELIDSGENLGSSMQEIQLVNGEIQQLLISGDSKLKDLQNEDIDRVFLSVLNRLATLDEKSRLGNLHFEDLVWVLTNSREFQFNL